MTSPKQAMILPPADSTGYIEQGYGTTMWLHGDDRIPAPLPDRDVRLVDSSANPECPRHLFDVIESAYDVETETPDGDWLYEIKFRARLTCVRCGHIIAWQGTRSGDTRNPPSVKPVPLVVGDVSAQQIAASNWGRDTSTWAVHRHNAPERVGVICGMVGPRGRAYFTGRLFEWPDGELVEAPTTLAVLRKLEHASSSTGAAGRRIGA